MTSRRESADLDLAATAARHLVEIKAFFARQRADGYLHSKADKALAAENEEILEKYIGRLLLGHQYRQEEMDLGRETDAGRGCPVEDPQRAMEQAI